MKRRLIIFIDSGDTIVDESTEIMKNGIVQTAKAIEGAVETLVSLADKGFRICLVADGNLRSFTNVFRILGIEDIFEAKIVSESVGVQKPHKRMFRTAMKAMNLTDDDRNRIVMIGNNLKRDIAGANRMGITSILLSYSPRYVMQPETEEEIPDYVVALPREIPPLLEVLDQQLQNRKILNRSHPEI
jgi:putative hydrolase of the HAD superfamily